LEELAQGAMPKAEQGPAAQQAAHDTQVERPELSRPQPAAEDNSLFGPNMTMDEIEREAIRRALHRTKGRRTEAAQLLGLSVRTLQRKIKEYDLDV
jgi:DNA-binding NtrC family response regulator